MKQGRDKNTQTDYHTSLQKNSSKERQKDILHWAVCYAANTEKWILTDSDLNPKPHPSKLCVLTIRLHTPLKRARHQAQVSQTVLISWRSIFHLLFWYSITLGFQPPGPTTFKVGGPVQTFGHHPYRWWYMPQEVTMILTLYIVDSSMWQGCFLW